ncbi:isopenicillin N synthase family dioxygenase [Subtercola boreus]|uniref:Oxidoreductase n=1 Tax=Subtercola boreus TaxID=120213 RepID=A0A3E0WBU5_9MICO|nr:2-oxoglutarate and iron-dependent oxygenase domain-containing protein [Subtercola boreus]RFA20621.1 oxidoreductase [Subtercola boreus]RFA20735.1 oxidoreductase [Subtercola boreus]RFA26946.1 oxidoreductase [Subtercola boreus]
MSLAIEHETATGTVGAETPTDETVTAAPGADALPVLDLSRLDRGDAEAEAFRNDLRRATHDYGFFYLTGHGIPGELIERVMRASRAFFALPEADKMAIENLRSPQFRGYTRVGGELTQGVVDWREQIDIGAERDQVARGAGVADYWRLEGPNQWPQALPELREVMTEWRDALTDLGLTLLRTWAVSLGAPQDAFDNAFAASPFPLIKIVRYPGRSDPEPQQGVGAHKDSGVLTLLYVEDGKAGLQVEKDGQWIDAPPLAGAFVVNIGELLEVATDGYLKATVHRVISPRLGDDRISIPFFLSPSLDAKVPTLSLPAELAQDAAGLTLDPGNPIYDTYGENALKSRLRAHPDVAAIHHSDIVTR